MDYWLALGVGPFLTMDMAIPTACYRGAPAPLSIGVGLAQAGPVQVELIEQYSEGPSVYRDCVPQGQTGLHHICRAFGSYDAHVAQARAQGIEIAMEVDRGGVRFCYADTRAHIGCMTEFVDDHPASRRMADMVRDAALDWDGSDPIRPHPLFQRRPI